MVLYLTYKVPRNNQTVFKIQNTAFFKAKSAPTTISPGVMHARICIERYWYVHDYLIFLLTLKVILQFIQSAIITVRLFKVLTDKWPPHFSICANSATSQQPKIINLDSEYYLFVYRNE